MRPTTTDIARSVVLYLSVCSAHGSCAKTAEPIEMPFRVLIHVGLRYNLLDRGPDFPREWALLRGT